MTLQPQMIEVAHLNDHIMTLDSDGNQGSLSPGLGGVCPHINLSTMTDFYFFFSFSPFYLLIYSSVLQGLCFCLFVFSSSRSSFLSFCVNYSLTLYLRLVTKNPSVSTFGELGLQACTTTSTYIITNF